MRNALVAIFRDKLKIPLWWEMIPEGQEFPCACYAQADEIKITELDGSGVQSREVVYDVDILCNTVDEVDLYKFLMVNLSGKRYHQFSDLFQIMILRSAEDGGPVLGVTTNADKTVHALTLRISLFE